MQQRGHWRRGVPHLKQRRQRLAKVLRERREALGLSTEYVSSAIGVSRKTYADQESGDRSIPTELLPVFARVLKISIRTMTLAIEAPPPRERPVIVTGAAA